MIKALLFTCCLQNYTMHTVISVNRTPAAVYNTIAALTVIQYKLYAMMNIILRFNKCIVRCWWL